MWGFATEYGACGFVDSCLTPAALNYFLEWTEHRTWYAFNMAFDGAWLTRYLGTTPKVGGCSFMVYRLLTSELQKGRQFRLEDAQQHVLGWPVESQKQWLAEALDRHGLPKDRMSELAVLEPEDFVRYCVLDAVASRDLWQYFQWRCLESEPEEDELGQALRTAWNYHQQLQIPQLRRVWTGQFEGCAVNLPRLQAYCEELTKKHAEALAALGTHPLWADIIACENARHRAAWEAKQWVTKRIRAKFKDEAWLHPDVWTHGPELTPKSAWEKKFGVWYREEQQQRKTTTLPKVFNFASDKQLSWLLYENLFSARFGNGVGYITVDGREVEVPLTKGGALPTGKTVYSLLGEAGSVLSKFSKLTKLLQYVQAYRDAAVKFNGRVHFKLRPGATLNGRVAGG